MRQSPIKQVANRWRCGKFLKEDCREAMMFNPVKASCAPLGDVQ
jgi:hypothetical protein